MTGEERRKSKVENVAGGARTKQCVVVAPIYTYFPDSSRSNSRNSEMEIKRSAYAQGYGATDEWRPGKLMVDRSSFVETTA